eukprot:CAMPEP_0181192214 /NCGR_PEP_ID=MMETSP1096-20121128/13162_1 /TAXON_ID=156174 ORGANISM="Chrysochromulina ericina, Strain CCMP281" /NCGR_SAMPLE_ID=MMETSP1096 /ASSEMBLY_ACC=CAM_ASM_000453 /LENGTH=158 /DNA_ID=CAMNT_0023281591 /DNA_START=124 /DNA_END=600 /DNA_ORIENTATION=+
MPARRSQVLATPRPHPLVTASLSVSEIIDTDDFARACRKTCVTRTSSLLVGPSSLELLQATSGAVNPRPPGPPADPCRPSQQAGRAQHAWGGRVHARPACTLSGTSYVRACTVGSRRKSACRVLRRIVGPRGQNPSVESVYRVPGHVECCTSEARTLH